MTEERSLADRALERSPLQLLLHEAREEGPGLSSRLQSMPASYLV